MSRTQQQDQQLERLLSAWGQSKALARPAGRRWRHWAPLAAGLLLAAAGGAALVLASRGPGDEGAASAEMQELRTKLMAANQQSELLGRQAAAAVAERDGLQAELDDAQAENVRLAEQARSAADQLARLQAEQIEDQAQVHEMLGTLDEMDRRNQQLAAQLAQAQSQAAAAGTSARTAADLRGQVADLQKRLDQWRARREAVAATWQAVVPDRRQAAVDAHALAAMQAGLRMAELLDRSSDAAKLSDSSTAELVRRLEVVFTRLRMADPADEHEQRWLGDVLGSDLPDRVAAALSDDGALADETWRFLAQSQVILLRGACAS